MMVRRLPRTRDRALRFAWHKLTAEPLAGLGLAVTIAGVIADSARPRGGAVGASPGD